MAMEVRCSRVEAVDVARLQLQVQAAPHFIHGGDADGLGRSGSDGERRDGGGRSGWRRECDGEQRGRCFICSGQRTEGSWCIQTLVGCNIVSSFNLQKKKRSAKIGQSRGWWCMRSAGEAAAKAGQNRRHANCILGYSDAWIGSEFRSAAADCRLQTGRPSSVLPRT
jgi:hypothetical protein